MHGVFTLKIIRPINGTIHQILTSKLPHGTKQHQSVHEWKQTEIVPKSTDIVLCVLSAHKQEKKVAIRFGRYVITTVPLATNVGNTLFTYSHTDIFKTTIRFLDAADKIHRHFLSVKLICLDVVSAEYFPAEKSELFVEKSLFDCSTSSSSSRKCLESYLEKGKMSDCKYRSNIYASKARLHTPFMRCGY